MGMAHLTSQRSTCSRLNVGAVISQDSRTVSMGYNGAAARLPHCDHATCICDPAPAEECPMHGACRTAVHAELNALMFAARFGLATEGAELHTTHQPCLNCAMAIVNSGVVRVVYDHPYRDNGGLTLLMDAGVVVQTMADMRRAAEINRRYTAKNKVQ